MVHNMFKQKIEKILTQNWPITLIIVSMGMVIITTMGEISEKQYFHINITFFVLWFFLLTGNFHIEKAIKK